ncbi:(d)CMP kinase [Zymomonas mobilis]|uniref:Cytidylate kinase n=1 Tax=Zymomonas mobilis subsp. mobilis (strain ATCC 10988 / DSM 424 / LMG 404 / NCIMB 8938 / NRRL B-806 / ZM1) TaxID=555217 RepID=A0A0H3FZU0_ZYMMA|nr:(d)CMP kinase [Zymomonas mobilis]AEH63177.1 cytidylate kinase [Zymomonas mobilis subsp. mobilis ATCC 10988]AHB10661.1 cytidylate kinase [Zymomonas mobilis subsp. mobilis str. CP4 = NRRL B-14023]AHJ70973.1 Cytidylate kinase [Zymomonas mobilis subsp. mobilis NRRL B-12526]AHJ72826.1 Cytidylate kinase [Zymomonas mobilis subsp. mobilis str. CP4 = NRRL B-14023]ART93794.1 cytidylate kinase [Zymomonas mobilis subsp. mobilis]
MIIAIDGPAASGKGTVARALARHYALPYLDTGLLYRAVAVSLLDNQGDSSRESDALSACDFADSLLSDSRLRSEQTGKLASEISVFPKVRQALIKRQRDFAAQTGGAVLDGRDIGTVIVPDADVKLFITASPEIRAKRRYDELVKNNPDLTYDIILEDIKSRDLRDSSRKEAPLKQAEDADLLDSSLLGIDMAIERAVALVEKQLKTVQG